MNPDESSFLHITPDAFDRWDEGDPLTEGEQREAFKNFKEALAFQGVGVEVSE